MDPRVCAAIDLFIYGRWRRVCAQRTVAERIKSEYVEGAKIDCLQNETERQRGADGIDKMGFDIERKKKSKTHLVYVLVSLYQVHAQFA